MKLIILAMLIAVIAALGSGLFYLSKDGQGSPRMLNALKIRVALSALLILMLVLAYFMGWTGPTPGTH
jgi:hypothetical protein